MEKLQRNTQAPQSRYQPRNKTTLISLEHFPKAQSIFQSQQNRDDKSEQIGSYSQVKGVQIQIQQNKLDDSPSDQKNQKIKTYLKWIIIILLAVAVLLTVILVPLYFKLKANMLDTYRQVFDAYLKQRNILISENQYQTRLMYYATADYQLQFLINQNLSWTAKHTIFSHLSKQEASSILKQSPANQSDIYSRSVEQKIQIIKKQLKVDVTAQQLNNPNPPFKQKRRMLSNFKDYTGPVQYQGNCGSCTMFATASALYNLHYKKYGYGRRFSQQQLVDCTYQRYCTGWWFWRSCYNDGCGGGFSNYNVIYARDRGVVDYYQYSYKGYRTGCQVDSGMRIISGYLSSSSCGTLDSLSTYTPVIVSMCAAPSFQRFYGGRIYQPDKYIRRSCYWWWGWRCSQSAIDECTGKGTNHALLAVGNGPNYIQLQNSWSSWWGENGYAKIAKWTCNICDSITYIY